jgi:hypothetical protein
MLGSSSTKRIGWGQALVAANRLQISFRCVWRRAGDLRYCLCRVHVVIHHQNAIVARRGSRISGQRDRACGAGLLELLGARSEGQVDDELAALAKALALRRYVPPVKFDKAPHDRQPQAKAPFRSVQRLRLLHEQTEDSVQHLGSALVRLRRHEGREARRPRCLRVVAHCGMLDG